MRFLLFLILAPYAVRCDDESNNYYVIEMPDVPRDYKKPFRVYWNVPTMQCKSKKIPFDNLYEKYGIIQNKDDKFLGENIAILYDPGLFPALLKDENSGKFKFRNGGVPQDGSLDSHLDAFKNAVSQSIPDTDFSGLGIIDFESWRPVFRQNFGVLTPYKEVSYEIEYKLHWWWPKAWIVAEATQRFEEAARTFMRSTVSIAKQMRPKALWGYYGFPYCFNMASNNMAEDCPSKVMLENDEAYWLWAESTALYPSVYSSQDLSSLELSSLIKGRLREASRLKKPGTLILPYFWYRYRDGGFLREGDLSTALQSLYKSNASGFIVWGSSNDVNTKEKCNKLKNYVENILGPYIAKYTKNSHRLQQSEDMYTLKPNTVNSSSPATLMDLDIDLTNNSGPLINIIEDELFNIAEEFNITNKLFNLNDSLIFNTDHIVSDKEKVIEKIELNNQTTTEDNSRSVITTTQIDNMPEATTDLITLTDGVTIELNSTYETTTSTDIVDILSSIEVTTEYVTLNESTTTESTNDSTTEIYSLLNFSTTSSYDMEDSEVEKIIDHEFFILFTNLSSQILDITTEDNFSNKKTTSLDLDEPSINEYEGTTEFNENLSTLDNFNSTETLSDEEAGFSAAVASTTSFVLLLCFQFLI